MFVNNALLELCRLSDSLEGEDSFHQRRVCIIAYEIAKELKFDAFGLDLIVKSALLHDVSLLSDLSKVETFRQIVYEDFGRLNSHAVKSGRVARFFNLHLDVTNAINYHHTPKDKNPSILGNILFLADNLEVAYRSLTNPYAFDEIVDFLDKKIQLFDESAFDALKRIARKECFWFSLLEENVDNKLLEIINSLPKKQADDRFKSALTYLIAFMSDSISPYFAKYTLLSKNIAVNLAYLLNLDTKLLSHAALLSHVGNLTMPFDTFNLPDIDDETYNLVKTHTYAGYHILKRLGFLREAELVLYHHENNLKEGYPCKIKPTSEVGVLAVATIVAAIMQDRPYREAKEDLKIKEGIGNFKSIGLFDADILDAFQKIDLRKVRQTKDEYYDAVEKIFNWGESQ